MIVGKQVRTSRSVIVNAIPLSQSVADHTPPAIVAKMKSYTGQAITTEMMSGIELMEATIKLHGSVAAAKMALGSGFTEIIDVIVTDFGLIGDNGARYAHTYIYAANVKSITPETTDDGTEGAEIKLSLKGYEMKMDGVTVDEIDSRTGLVMLGGNTIVEAVV